MFLVMSHRAADVDGGEGREDESLQRGHQAKLEPPLKNLGGANNGGNVSLSGQGFISAPVFGSRRLLTVCWSA